MNTPWQPAAWQTPNRSMPTSVSRTARPITAPAAQRVEVVAGDAAVQVLAVGDQGAQPVQVGEPVTVLTPGAGRVHEPNREFSVGVEVHSRSLATRPELRG